MRSVLSQNHSSNCCAAAFVLLANIAASAVKVYKKSLVVASRADGVSRPDTAAGRRRAVPSLPSAALACRRTAALSLSVLRWLVPS